MKDFRKHRVTELEIIISKVTKDALMECYFVGEPPKVVAIDDLTNPPIMYLKLKYIGIDGNEHFIVYSAYEGGITGGEWSFAAQYDTEEDDAPPITWNWKVIK